MHTNIAALFSKLSIYFISCRNYLQATVKSKFETKGKKLKKYLKLQICKICQRDTEDLTSITNPDNTEELENFEDQGSVDDQDYQENQIRKNNRKGGDSNRREQGEL